MTETKLSLGISNTFFLLPLLEVLGERGEYKIIGDLDRRFKLTKRPANDFLDVYTVIHILDTVVDEAQIHDIGLRIAAKHQLSSYGTLGTVIDSAGIFIDVINSYVHHINMITNIVTPKFERHDRGAFEIGFVFNFRHQLLENVFGNLFMFSLQNLFNQILGESCKPTRVKFTGNSHKQSDNYGLVFNGELTFNNPLNVVSYDSYWLSRRLDNEDKVFDYLYNKLVILSGNEAKVSELYDLLRVVFNCLEVDHCFNQAQIAKFLGFSKRTLVRRYQSINIKFTELIDIYRRRKSVDLLSNRALTINEVAYGLGFWERSTFDKKFRTWYGITPAKLRRVFLYQDAPAPTKSDTQYVMEGVREMH